MSKFSSKLRSLIDHFKSVTDNFLKNVDKLNKETKNKPINAKELLKCYGIDVISKFVFALDTNSYFDKLVFFLNFDLINYFCYLILR